MTISAADVLTHSLRDPRLATYAVSALPAWLWSSDGAKVLWANSSGAAVFGHHTSVDLAAHRFGLADRHRRQVARLAMALPSDGSLRLERVQGFGAALGQLRTCACRQLIAADGTTGVLMVATEPAGRAMAYPERIRRLVDGLDNAAAFDRAGKLIAASASATALIASERSGQVDLSVFGLDQAAAEIQDGHVTVVTPEGSIDLLRLGHGSELTWLALISPPVAQPIPAVPAEDHEAGPVLEAASPSGATQAAEAAPLPERSHDTVAAAPAETDAPCSTAEPHAPFAAPAPPEAAASLTTAPLDSDATEHVVTAGMATPAPVEPIAAALPAPTLEPIAAVAALASLERDEALAPGEVTAVELPPDTVLPETAGAVASLEDFTTRETPERALEPDHAGLIHDVGATPNITRDVTNRPDLDATANDLPPPPSIALSNGPDTTETASQQSAQPDLAAPPEETPHVEPREAEPSGAANPPEPAPPVTRHDVDAAALSLPHEPATPARRHPLRFVWQMDAEGRFALGVDEFARLIGPRTATAFGRPWSEIVTLFGLDPEGRVTAAIATRHTWSGITVNWPVDGRDIRLPVELSALPIFDRNRQFQGYRGFGLCRDLDALERLAAQRRHDAMRPTPPDTDEPPPAPADAHEPPASASRPFVLHSQPTDSPVETPQNVVPFRLANEPKAPTLTPVENNAFNELARQLASRLEVERSELSAREPTETTSTSIAAPTTAADADSDVNGGEPSAAVSSPEPAPWKPDNHAPPRAESRRDALLYDRIPVGVLVYQLDRLLYANRAFLDRVGYSDLQSLATAGGLDALFVEPGVTGGGSTSEEGTPVRIAASGDDELPTDARLHSILWDGDAAHALIFSATQGSSQGSSQESSQGSAPGSATPAAPEAIPAPPVAVSAPAPDPSTIDLDAIFSASDDGIFILDRDARILRHNDGALRVFGAAEREAMPAALADLFAPGSQSALLARIDALRHADDPQTRQADELIGLSRDGRNVPLRLTMGQTDASGARFFVICRETPVVRHDHDQSRKQQFERAATARADILATISQDIRTPLNAIIGFADVMIEERFGALGNDRYAAYLRDIRASGERVLAIVNDMVDLSRAETGQLHLSLVRQDLNEIVEQCVTVLQPQANRERIIIRTSLAQALPPVTADAAALRQIVLNLVGNSIQVARAGGQIIVSTAVTDLGDIVLRVRDTGRGLNHSEMEAALERFRTAGADHVAQDNGGINLSLTRVRMQYVQ